MLKSAMRELLYGFLLIIGITSCSNKPEFREEIIERYSGGEKKIVAQYSGKGIDERLVNRFTYDETGDLILKEDLQNNIKLDWNQLNPDVNTVIGLKNFLQGGWVSVRIEWLDEFELDEYTKKDLIVSLNVNKDKATLKSNDGFEAISFLEYKNNHIIMTKYIDEFGKHVKTDDSEIMQLVIMSNNSFALPLGEQIIYFQRN